MHLIETKYRFYADRIDRLRIRYNNGVKEFQLPESWHSSDMWENWHNCRMDDWMKSNVLFDTKSECVAYAINVLDEELNDIIKLKEKLLLELDE